MSKYPFNVMTILVFVAAAALLWAVPVRADQPIAKINGQEISESEFLEALKRRYGQYCLEAMIEALAIRQEATQRKVAASDEEVNERFEPLRRRVVSQARSTLPPQEVFALWLVQQRLTEEILRESFAVQILLEKMVADDVKVTPLEVGQYYETHPQEFERPEAIKVSHICVTTQEQAEKIRQDILEERISFEEAAKKYSIDPYGRDNGGELPWMGRAPVPDPALEPMRDEAFKLRKDGELSPVFKTIKGYEILRRDGYQQAGTIAFEEVQDQLEQRLHTERIVQEAKEMRRAIMKMAKIEQLVHFPQPGAAPAASED